MICLGCKVLVGAMFSLVTEGTDSDVGLIEVANSDDCSCFITEVDVLEPALVVIGRGMASVVDPTVGETDCRDSIDKSFLIDDLLTLNALLSV